MKTKFLKSKIHRATVTDANLEYEGSITIDRELMDASGLHEYEKVHVLNITNGARVETYVIVAPRGSKEICINGAAAHLIRPKDCVIILSYCALDCNKISKFKPTIVKVNNKNEIID